MNGEKIETPSVRRTEVRTSGTSDYEDGVTGIASIGQITSNDTSGLSGTVGEVYDREDRRTISGGILKQLIEETFDQLQINEEEHKRLTSRLHQLQNLFKELSQKTGEALSDHGEEE